MATNSSYTLSVGELVSSSLATFFRNFIPFTVMGLLVLSPWIAFRLWFGNEPNHLAINFGNLVLQVLLGYVLTGAVTFGVVRQLSGNPASMGETVSQGLSMLGRTIATGIVCAVRIFLFSLLLIVPGIMETARLYVAMPVAIMEGKGVGDSIERSKALTLGSRWQVFGAWVIVIVIGLALGFALGFFAVMLLHNPGDGTIATLEIVVALLQSTFGATMMSVCYSLLRRGKENVDVKALSAVFA